MSMVVRKNCSDLSKILFPVKESFVMSSNSTNNTNMSGNHLIRVFFRIFPVDKPNSDLIMIKNNSKVYVKKMLPHKQDNVGNFWAFETDGVFNSCNQEQVFTDVVGDVIEKIEDGQSAVIISFGKTGSGKSATMAGLDLSEVDCGIGPRIIRKLLILKKSLQRNKKMCIKMSNVEFSNYNVFDLFKEYPNQIEDHWAVAKKLVKIKVNSEMEALRELYAGEGRKETRPVKNYMSHVNTTILTFYVTTRDMDYSVPRQIIGKIHLVDMAGSDTIGNLSCIFKTKFEIGTANLNKSFMEQFFLALCERSNEMIKIKQRGNPLIHYLGGDVRTQGALRFIGHITTCIEDYNLTVSMLRFGQIVKGFKPTVVNLSYEISPEHKLKFLQNKIDELEKQRIQSSILLNQDLSMNLNCDRIKHLNKTIKQYLHNEITEIDVMSVADASTIFKMFKDMLEQKHLDRKGMKELGESETSISRRKSSSGHGKEKRTSNKGKREGSTFLKKQKSIDKVDKQISAHSLKNGLPPEISKHSKTPEPASPSANQLKPPKKIKSKTTAGRSSFKRRSLLSINSSERMTEQSFVPESIPENTEAWNEFSKNSNYNLFTEEYKANEKSILDSYTEYLIEIKKLQGYKNQIESMKQELLEANLLMKFKEKSNEVDQYTETILNEAELICKYNMEKAEKSKVEQQEVVLRCLAELKIYLNNRKDLRKRMTDDFESFCKMKFNMPLPQIKSLSDIELVNESKYATLEVEGPSGSAEEQLKKDLLEKERRQQFSHFKEVMIQERKKLQKARNANKPYILAPLPEHRDPSSLT